MPNDPAKHHQAGMRNRHRQPSNGDPGKTKPTFTKFMLDSDIKPVIFLGKCVQYFGWGTVGGFLLGVAFLYGYAFVTKSLPLVTFAGEQAKESRGTVTVPTPSPVPMRSLRGVVKINDKQLIEDIEIGVLSMRPLGPFQGGEFSIQVPESTDDHYQITLWNMGYQRFKLVELIPDHDGYVHDIVFPAGVASIQANHRQNETASTIRTRSDWRGLTPSN